MIVTESEQWLPGYVERKREGCWNFWGDWYVNSLDGGDLFISFIYVYMYLS